MNRPVRCAWRSVSSSKLLHQQGPGNRPFFYSSQNVHLSFTGTRITSSCGLFMRHLLISLLIVLVVSPAFSQATCGRGAGNPVNMQVMLVFEDRGSLLVDSEAGAGGLST